MAEAGGVQVVEDVDVFHGCMTMHLKAFSEPIPAKGTIRERYEQTKVRFDVRVDRIQDGACDNCDFWFRFPVTLHPLGPVFRLQHIRDMVLTGFASAGLDSYPLAIGVLVEKLGGFAHQEALAALQSGRRLDRVAVVICCNLDQLREVGRAALPPMAVDIELQLERLTYQGGDIGRFSQKVCPICHDDFEQGSTEVTAMPCSHVFHHSCLTEWLQRSCRCPVCKFEIPTASTARRTQNSS